MHISGRLSIRTEDEAARLCVRPQPVLDGGGAGGTVPAVELPSVCKVAVPHGTLAVAYRPTLLIASGRGVVVGGAGVDRLRVEEYSPGRALRTAEPVAEGQVLR